ncbi:hypothetical protein P3G55_10570 [Leptospira sp. 96542]|nr:hypothetical protein [Leptospira sp. 96542]
MEFYTTELNITEVLVMPHKNGKIYGSFKKICIPILELAKEKEILKDSLNVIKYKYESKELSDVEVCFQLIVLFLSHRVRRHKFLRMGKPLPEVACDSQFLNIVRFYGMPDSVRFALWKWQKKEWDLRLVDYCPTSFEMLESQSLGFRYVTFSWEHALNGDLLEGVRDAFEHLLHDLSHAYMFFREEYDHPGQILFFKRMLYHYHDFLPYIEKNEVFANKFEYCISDMNSHPAHLEAYLNAICRESGFNLNLTKLV